MRWVGVELLVVGMLVSLTVLNASRPAPGSRSSQPATDGPTEASVISRRLLGLGSALLIALAGLLLLLEVGGGLYWWPAAIVTAYVGALVNAWVLLGSRSSVRRPPSPWGFRSLLVVLLARAE